MSRAPMFLCAALLCGCVRVPDTYAPPAQRRFPEDRSTVDALIVMNANDAPQHIVQDISPILRGRKWRWTGRSPSLDILLDKTTGLKYSIDFTLWDGAIQQTGPLTISFKVNGHLLAKETYAAPGPKHFEQRVPADWLLPARENVAAAEVNKVFVDPSGNRYGFILDRMGFAPE